MTRYDFVDSIHGRDAAPCEDLNGEFVAVADLRLELAKIAALATPGLSRGRIMDLLEELH